MILYERNVIWSEVFEIKWRYIFIWTLNIITIITDFTPKKLHWVNLISLLKKKNKTNIITMTVFLKYKSISQD